MILLLVICLFVSIATGTAEVFDDDSDGEGDPEQAPLQTGSAHERPATAATGASSSPTAAGSTMTMTTETVTSDQDYEYHDTKEPGYFAVIESSVNSSANSADDMEFKVGYPTGKHIGSDSFNGKNVVCLPSPTIIVPGRSRLKITKDYMQTALDAFAIIYEGSTRDVLALPPRYVLESARTISMMKLPREKLEATWTVIKQGRHPSEVPHETLERFRPMFKYASAHDMADLNLSDNRIMNYLGTHPELDRHQVGIIAARYIALNPKWQTAEVINRMNNLVCGLPIIIMRSVKLEVYLQLSEQLFYHINACDKLQKKFFLGMMSQTQVLGKANSWDARDVTRLGLLLPELPGRLLSNINPRSMIGISSKVMMAMREESLQHLTETQIRHLADRVHNVFQLKMAHYTFLLNRAVNMAGSSIYVILIVIYMFV